MAKQVGPHFFTGTIDGVIFYKLGGQYYVRSKGDYKSGKQMRKDPRLKRTMQRADQFGVASKLVKPIYYRYLPKAVRKHGLFGKLTGMVNRLIQEGKGKDEVKELLIAHCQNLAARATQPILPNQQSTINEQPLLIKHQQPAIAYSPRTTVNQQRSISKRARYLSNWKVKRNGRLYIPKPVTIVDSLKAIPDLKDDSACKSLFLEKNE